MEIPCVKFRLSYFQIRMIYYRSTDVCTYVHKKTFLDKDLVFYKHVSLHTFCSNKGYEINYLQQIFTYLLCVYVSEHCN